MACACKGNSTKKQVTSVKQVVKRTTSLNNTSNNIQKRNITKRVLFRRSM